MSNKVLYIFKIFYVKVVSKWMENGVSIQLKLWIDFVSMPFDSMPNDFKIKNEPFEMCGGLNNAMSEIDRMKM